MKISIPITKLSTFKCSTHEKMKRESKAKISRPMAPENVNIELFEDKTKVKFECTIYVSEENIPMEKGKRKFSSGIDFTIGYYKEDEETLNIYISRKCAFESSKIHYPYDISKEFDTSSIQGLKDTIKKVVVFNYDSDPGLSRGTVTTVKR